PKAAEIIRLFLAPAPRPGATAAAPTHTRNTAAPQADTRIYAQQAEKTSPLAPPNAITRSAALQIDPPYPQAIPEASSAPLTLDSLPVPWRQIYEKIKPAPIIWTYMELAHDLLEDGDPERRELFKRIIRSLNLPKGSSSFLPLQLPGLAPEEKRLEGDIFIRFLRHLGCRILIILGQVSLENSPYSAAGLGHYQGRILSGRLVHLLPDPQSMLRDHGKVEAAILYLRSSLASINLPRM
ncbi:MAG: hypothetical protein LBD82_02320, partial [Deltaproteobacteria bacterium]|nr:hypothetical protein [Deltaproteobacteria bacterium]